MQSSKEPEGGEINVSCLKLPGTGRLLKKMHQGILWPPVGTSEQDFGNEPGVFLQKDVGWPVELESMT